MLLMLISTFTITNVFTTTTDNLDASGKRLTYYSSSLFIAHNARPLITFNDTKIVNVMIKFKPTKMGRAPVLSKTCSLGQKEFMDNILDSLRKSNRATRRLLFLPGFSRLIECGSYVSRMYQTISKIPSTMVCPQAYRTTLKKNARNGPFALAKAYLVILKHGSLGASGDLSGPAQLDS